MTFSFFLSIYSRCGAPASWAARHTTVCLDQDRHYLNVAFIKKQVKGTIRNYKLDYKTKKSSKTRE